MVEEGRSRTLEEHVQRLPRLHGSSNMMARSKPCVAETASDMLDIKKQLFVSLQSNVQIIVAH